MSVAVLSMPLENQAVRSEVLRFHVKYDPTLPPGEQFSFFQNNESHNRLFPVDGPREVVITLEGATFSTYQGHHGLYWLIGPDQLPDVKEDSTRLIFQLPEPAIVVKPWNFGLVVDTEDVKGILSPPIYLAKRLPPHEREHLTLLYDPASWIFHLQDGDTGHMISVAATDVLILAIQPGEQSTITIGLAATHGPQPAWADQPVVWDSGSLPDWVTPAIANGDLQLTFHSSGAGKTAGFQFAIQVPQAGQAPMTVRSPDPILVNTTIGDG